MKSIMQVCFSLDDCKLYLDTHPDCPKALAYYEKLQKKRFRLVDEYSDKYGALEASSVNTDQGWDWNKGRLPWEGDD
jgi:spore coat protein JB